MSVLTRVVLGTRETPSYVSADFYDLMQTLVASYALDTYLHPTTIRYYVPTHFVVERWWDDFDKYEMDLDDTYLVPRCRRRKVLNRLVYKHHVPMHAFDRMTVTTERCIDDSYYLLVPNALYYHTTIFREWNESHIYYNGMLWNVHFRHVYVDPHEKSSSTWFYGTPRFQIELTSSQDFSNNRNGLKEALLQILPRAFRWDSTTMSGNNFAVA